MVFLLSHTYNGYAQVNAGNLFVPSPNASNLGKYGDIPVSLYTGIPNIQIPIYTIQHRDLSLPVSLSYHASGIRVQDESSWVGLGWSLNAGGCITRIVNGLDDLHKTEKSAYGRDDWPAPSPFEYLGFPYEERVTNNPTDAYKTKVCQGYVDPEPDQFYFNFGNYSGSFIFKQGQNINSDFLTGTCEKDENIRIIFTKSLKQWTITTPDGVKYYFKTREVNERQSNSNDQTFPNSVSFANYNSMCATAWYLDKVESPTGAVINLEYDVRAQQNYTYSDYGCMTVPDRTDQCERIIDVYSMTGGNTNCLPKSLNSVFNVTVNFTELMFLKRIYWDNGEISFSKSARSDMVSANLQNFTPYCLSWLKYPPQKLDEIIIKDNSGNDYKHFVFNYSYFNNSYTGANPEYFKRLKLMSVNEYGSNTSTSPGTYSMTYDESIALPSKQSFARDFWGYYNGKTTNNSLVPYGSYFKPNGEKIAVGTADRFPDATNMKAGILTNITYPTGGNSTFNYEPNDYYTFGNGAFAFTDFEKYEDANVSVSSIKYSDQYDYFTLTKSTSVTFSFLLRFEEYCRLSQNSNPFNSTYGYHETQMYAFIVQVDTNIDPTLSTLNPATMNVVWSMSLGDWLNRTPLTDCERKYSTTKVLPAGKYKIYTGYFPYWYTKLTATYSNPGTPSVKKDAAGVYEKQAGGLRIAKVVHSSTGSPSTMSKYVYRFFDPSLNSSKSTGRLMMFPSNHSPWSLYIYDGSNGICNVSYSFLKGTSWSNSPLGNSAQGGSVGYDKVIVYTDDEGLNGRTEYNYHNVEERLDPGVYIEGFPNITDPMNGMLMSEIHYSGDNNIVQRKEFDYYSSQQLDVTKGFKYFKPINSWQSTLAGTIDLSCNSGVLSKVYDKKVYIIRPSYLKHYSYSGNTSTPVCKSEYYTYNTLGQMINKKVTNSNGSVNETQTKYPADFTTGVYPAMVTLNMLNYPIEETTLVNGSVTSSKLTTYKTNNSSYVPDKVYSFETATPLAATSFTPFNGSFKDSHYGSTPELSCDDYNTNGTVRQLIGRDGITTAYLWDATGNYQIAQVKGATYEQVKAYNGQAATTDSQTLFNNIKSLVPNAFTTTFTYKPLYGLTSQTDPAGRTSYYDYDTFGRLKLVKDLNQNILKKMEYHYAGQN
jgi:YD repeat-containing protein